ncbi:ankyrin repeats (3 copies) domain-containing protein [Phthorimaea operculella]|nr:ankyrin repeats (3 copies) domain-containing protein [Phthorimaea operculella]
MTPPFPCYTPLMLAAKSGNYNAVRMLLEASPDCINLQMPNSGNTALFLAVEGACCDATNRRNKSKVSDHFSCTISILLENHADITKPNHSGITINDLLTENSNAELSMIFANKVTSRFFDGHLPGGSKFDNYMLLKSKEGNVDITELKKPDSENGNAKSESKVKNEPDSENKGDEEASKSISPKDQIIIHITNKTTKDQNLAAIRKVISNTLADVERNGHPADVQRI